MNLNPTGQMTSTHLIPSRVARLSLYADGVMSTSTGRGDHALDHSRCLTNLRTELEVTSEAKGGETPSLLSSNLLETQAKETVQGGSVQGRGNEKGTARGSAQTAQKGVATGYSLPSPPCLQPCVYFPNISV